MYCANDISLILCKACIVSSKLIYNCPVKTCFLRDANGGNPLREETGFCDSCKRSMNEKGWRFP